MIFFDSKVVCSLEPVLVAYLIMYIMNAVILGSPQVALVVAPAGRPGGHFCYRIVYIV